MRMVPIGVSIGLHASEKLEFEYCLNLKGKLLSCVVILYHRAIKDCVFPFQSAPVSAGDFTICLCVTNPQ